MVENKIKAMGQLKHINKLKIFFCTKMVVSNYIFRNFIKMKPSLILLSFLIFLNNPLQSQVIPIVDDDKLKVFIDCNFCDISFIKQEITYLSYVRDRLLADVHIQLAHQNSGSGGDFYTFYFYGQQDLVGYNDTLSLSLDANQTFDEIRRSQMKIIQLGLVSYMVKKGFTTNLNLSVNGFNEKQINEEDVWNNWVFSLNASGWFSGEELYKTFYSYGYFKANRITEDYKIESSLGFDYNLTQYILDEDKIESEKRSQNGDLSIIKSLNNHWSAGVFTDAQSSIYENYKFNGSLQTGIEYNIFPYDQSTKKQIRIQYRVGGIYNIYNDTTIYNQLRETLSGHGLNIAAKFQEKWGSVSGSITGSHYFHNFKLNTIKLRLTLEMRLFKGLSWRVSGNLALIHDQISLPKEGTSNEDILLRQRQLQTGYRYWASTGISYTFGSIYNSVVNPRFGN